MGGASEANRQEFHQESLQEGERILWLAQLRHMALQGRMIRCRSECSLVSGRTIGMYQSTQCHLKLLRLRLRTCGVPLLLLLEPSSVVWKQSQSLVRRNPHDQV